VVSSWQSRKGAVFETLKSVLFPVKALSLQQKIVISWVSPIMASEACATALNLYEIKMNRGMFKIAYA